MMIEFTGSWLSVEYFKLNCIMMSSGVQGMFLSLGKAFEELE